VAIDNKLDECALDGNDSITHLSSVIHGLWPTTCMGHIAATAAATAAAATAAATAATAAANVPMCHLTHAAISAGKRPKPQQKLRQLRSAYPCLVIHDGTTHHLGVGRNNGTITVPCSSSSSSSSNHHQAIFD